MRLFKVLIIDDEEMIREGLRTAIDWKSLGCKIVGEAEDGDEGLEMIGSLKPDIVFTDIRMPGLNGLEMVSKMRELKYDCMIILLTGFRDFDYAQQAIKLGAFRYLLKPTKTEEIILAVEEAAKEIRKIRSEQDLLNNLKKKVKEQYGLPDSTPSMNESASEKDSLKSKFLVSKALEIMKNNYTKDLSLKDVSDELYISTWYLSKLLKKETGSTFIDILNTIRIEEAKKLLLDPKFKVYEIASRVGYVDTAYFTRLFKKVTGMAPLEYKNSSVSS